MDIDIITGWNIFGFDIEYIMKRAVMKMCDQTFYEMSKLKDHTCELNIRSYLRVHLVIMNLNFTYAWAVYFRFVSRS